MIDLGVGPAGVEIDERKCPFYAAQDFSFLVLLNLNYGTFFNKPGHRIAFRYSVYCCRPYSFAVMCGFTYSLSSCP